MLKMTKTVLELIPVADMYIFCEKGTRGGISNIYNRYNKVNNKHLNRLTQNNNQNILHNSKPIIYVVIECLNILQQVNSNG